MHRSGTSALTGTLSLLDVYLGSELMQSNFANEKGYFENNIIYNINENLLFQINSSWDDVFYDESKLENIKEFNELKKTIQMEFEYANLFAIKDPRIAYLFPIYKKVLEELEIKIKIIFPYRNPIEVTNSLKKRNNMSLEKGMLLWAYHFLLAEKFTRTYKRVFLSFDELIENPEKTINKISSSLSLSFEEKFKINQKEIEHFLEPKLKHHNISPDNLSENIPKIIKDILSLKEQFNNSVLHKEFDKLRNDFFGYKKLFYNEDLISEIISLKLKLQDKDKELSKANNTIQDKDKELSKANNTIQDKDKELSKANNTIQDKDKELLKANNTIQDKDNELLKANNTIQDKDNELLKANNTIQDKDNELLKANNTIQDKDNELLKANNTIQDKDNELLKANNTIQDKDNELLKANNTIQDKDKELTKANNTIQTKDKELSKANNIILDKDKELSKANNTIQTKDKELSKANNIILDKDKELSKANNTIQTKNKELEILKDELTNIYTSKSWNITRPLRKVKRVLKK
jgi:hypothetical protein